MKVADFIVNLPFDEVVWYRANHECIILVNVFPFVTRRPWKLQGTQCLANGESRITKGVGEGGRHGRVSFAQTFDISRVQKKTLTLF